MSKLLSLKMDENIFLATEKIVRKLHVPRNAYINKAVDFFNRVQRRKNLAKALRMESRAVSLESRAVLRAFESLEENLP